MTMSSLRVLAEVLAFIFASAAGLAFLRVRFDLSQEVAAELLMTAAVAWGASLLLRDRGRKARAPDTGTAPAARAPAPARYEVRCTDDEISVHVDGVLGGGVRWNDLRLVGIRIDEAFLPQPWWWLTGAAGDCAYPNDADGRQEAHRQMSERLAGFDHRRHR